MIVSSTTSYMYIEACLTCAIILFPRFYCVDFDIPNLVISIKDPMPVSREKKKWGHRKIAVEGEYPDTSASPVS